MDASLIRAAARLLEYRAGAFVAFAPHATVTLVEEPRVAAVPGAPYYALGLMQWQGGWIPLIDLNALVRGYPEADLAVPRHVLVLAWQPVPGAPLEHGAVCARLLVRMIEVEDAQACELPADSDLWPWIAMSCFEHEGRSVPIRDTAKLFGQAHA